jgi:flagellar motor switch/type III secretory pathway protein FliN
VVLAGANMQIAKALAFCQGHVVALRQLLVLATELRA